MQVAIVIPIYKSRISKNEEISLLRGLQVLCKYPIIFICPAHLDVTWYENFCRGKVAPAFIRFDDAYFEGIEGYNKLMLSAGFYKKFIHYKYILIYQLDAFVFRDELQYWCKKDYDYIGAPWFKKDSLAFWCVGNGGFSLRKVKTFIKVLSKFKIIKSPRKVYWRFKNLTLAQFLLKLPEIVWRMFGYKNNYRYLSRHYHLNEDRYWAYEAKKITKFKIPEPKEALAFSFEVHPEYCFELNNFKLPFGCHAWEKYNPEFWKDYL